jgi:hypothetical protein
MSGCERERMSGCERERMSGCERERMSGCERERMRELYRCGHCLRQCPMYYTVVVRPDSTWSLPTLRPKVAIECALLENVFLTNKNKWRESIKTSGERRVLIKTRGERRVVKCGGL